MENLLCKVEFSSIQNILLALVVVFASLSIIFMIIFIIQSIKEKKANKVEEDKVNNIFENANIVT